jgi:hypothetical protein
MDARCCSVLHYYLDLGFASDIASPLTPDLCSDKDASKEWRNKDQAKASCAHTCP